MMLYNKVIALEKKVAELEQKITNLTPKRTLTKFTPPTLQEVELYAFTTKKLSKQGASFFAQKFHSHYEANGWMVGRNKMKSWEAAARKWDWNETTTTNTITNGKFNSDNAERIANDASNY